MVKTKIKLNLKNKHFLIESIILIILILISWIYRQEIISDTKIIFNQEQENEEILSGAKIFITKVIDGDTIEDEFGRRFRYIGIDTSEMNFYKNELQPDCFALESSLKNKELVLNKKVKVVFDKDKKDKFNRWLVYIYADDVFVNLELVEQGYAVSKSYFPNAAHQDEFEQAQAFAQENNLGFWQTCAK